MQRPRFRTSLVVLAGLVVFAILAWVAAEAASGDPLTLGRWTIASAEGSQLADPLQMRVTLGQPVVGGGAVGPLSLRAGFLAPAPLRPPQMRLYLPLVQRME